jgi:ribosomal protein S18 acetylase RimI-like enzyme
MNDFIIREYNTDDEKDVVDLWSKCGLIAPQNNPKLDIKRKLRVNPEWFLVGELEGKIVATCMAGYEGHRGWINYLAVVPKYRRKGYATQIMQEAERILREAGCPKVNLQVRTTNTDVIKFYKAIGYDIDDVVSMGKRLKHDCLYMTKGDNEQDEMEF